MSRQSANEFLTVEVVNTVERRRWPLAEKLRIVEESSRPGMSVSYVARKYGVAPSLLFRWRKLMQNLFTLGKSEGAGISQGTF